MNTHQQLLDIIGQLPDEKLSSLINLAIVIKNRQDSLEKIQVDSQAYQEWLSPDNDIYDEFFADEATTG